MTHIVEFVDPPVSPSQGRAQQLLTRHVVEILQAEPGKWARIFRDIPESAHSSWRSRFNAHGCQVRSVVKPSRNGTRVIDLYARWLSDEELEAQS